jgi:hypothetical protein
MYAGFVRKIVKFNVLAIMWLITGHIGIVTEIIDEY